MVTDTEQRHASAAPRRRGVMDWPETNVVLFAFLLNLPWEMWQIPLFTGTSSLAHWDGVVMCTRATVGDAVIALCAFWLVATVCTRDWIRRPSGISLGAFVAAGLVATIALEYWATRIGGRWEYAEAMPRLPLLGTGLAPLLQWLLLPPLVVWLVRRQIR
ncbi:hypothetical protein [Sulfuritalea sp.]|uniref:hypothetical protein n=1 Tax=Sulfuritalea sp. TaxID=2480090 RepID=UPI00286D6D2E|nr:hypothetical protein [Sulfuritalea sp.]